jgi:hypothetical protein
MTFDYMGGTACARVSACRTAALGCPLAAGQVLFGRINLETLRLLKLQNFLFLSLAHLFHLLDFAVSQLLNLV